MPVSDRAKQFMPFSALKGLETSRVIQIVNTKVRFDDILDICGEGGV